MPSVYDLYTFYIEPADLKGQSHAVKISAAKVDQVYDPILKRDMPRLVLSFANHKKVMPLNKTQAASVTEITGTDDYSKWAGAILTLTAAPSRNGKQTITITQTAQPAQKG